MNFIKKKVEITLLLMSIHLKPFLNPSENLTPVYIVLLLGSFKANGESTNIVSPHLKLVLLKFKYLFL